MPWLAWLQYQTWLVARRRAIHWSQKASEPLQTPLPNAIVERIRVLLGSKVRPGLVRTSSVLKSGTSLADFAIQRKKERKKEKEEKIDGLLSAIQLKPGCMQEPG